MLNKKAISEIINIGLLLLITIIIFSLIYSWSLENSNNKFIDLEVKENKIEYIGIDSTYLYLKSNSNQSNITIKIGSSNCGSFNLSKDINYIDISSCGSFQNLKTYNLFVKSNNQILRKVISLKTIDYSGVLNCSTLPGGIWSKVPADYELGTPEFCVMTYEARWDGNGSIYDSTNKYCGNENDYNSNGCPIDGSIGVVSKNSEKPLTQINMYQADILCEYLGEGFSLISNKQWMSIARNAQFVNENWDSGEFNNGSLFRGNNGINSINSYNGNNPQFPSTDNKSRLFLDNGEEVWDMSGNIWELIDEVLNCTSIGQPCTGIMPQDSTPNANEFITFDNVVDTGKFSENELFPYNVSWNWDTKGVGNLKVENSGPNSEGSYLFVLIRGGYHNALTNERGGIFVGNFENNPYISNPVVGFRCTYQP